MKPVYECTIKLKVKLYKSEDLLQKCEIDQNIKDMILGELSDEGSCEVDILDSKFDFE